MVYLGYLLFARYVITRHHRRGIRQMKAERYSEAITAFEASLAFFSRHTLLDKYRYVTLLSGSAACYREMALCNIAFAYSQLGDGAKARAVYERTVQEFPGSGLAKAALKLMDSAEQSCR